jgi:Spy/CpxP family protein refolding chaperone
MKPATILKTVLSSLLVVTLAFSQGMERPGPAVRHGKMFEKLNLTDSQKKDVAKINTDFAKQRVDQQAKIKTATIDLRALLQADTPDRTAIQKKIDEISDLQAKNRMLRVDHWFAVNKLLNPDQQKIWKTMLNRPLMERFGRRMGNMRGRMMMRENRESMPPDSPSK